MPDQVTAVLDHLAARGYTLPLDPLATEIIVVALFKWGSRRVISGLDRHLDGPDPTYALEPIGAALGEEYECPHQLIRVEQTNVDVVG